jgi:hypothetical protein
MDQPDWIFALSAFVKKRSPNWQAFAGAEGPLVLGLRQAIHYNSADQLSQAAELLNDSAFASALSNLARTETSLIRTEPPPAAIDTDRTSAFARAWIATAQATRILVGTNRRDAKELKEDLVAAVRSAMRHGASKSSDVDGLLCLARECLGEYAGWQTVFCWTAGWAESKTALHAVGVPVAAVSTNGAVILRIMLDAVDSPIEGTEVVVRYDCALDLIDQQALSAIDRCASYSKTAVEWSLQRPRQMQHQSLRGDSLGGALAAGFRLLAARRQFSPECLIVGTADEDGSLGKVGSVIPKLEAALHHPEIQTAVIRSNLGHDLRRFHAAGLAVLERDTLEAATEAADAVNSEAARNKFSIELSRRSFVFSPIPSSRLHTVRTVKGRFVFDAGDLGTYTHLVHFSPENRCRENFEIGYRTEADDSLIEAYGVPGSCNLWPSEHVGTYNRYKLAYNFVVNPIPDQPYRLTTNIYRGFKSGYRNVHCHIPTKARITSVEFELDLTRYLDPVAWDLVIQEESLPYLYWQRFALPQESAGDCETHKQRLRSKSPEPPIFSQKGYWFWRFSDVEAGGMALLDWEHMLVPRGQP